MVWRRHFFTYASAAIYGLYPMSVSHATSTEAESYPSHEWIADDGFKAWPFYQRSWRLLKPVWPIFLYHLFSDFVGRATSFGFAVLVLLLVVMDFQAFVADASLLAWFPHLLETLGSPAFIVGAVTSFSILMMLVTALEALVLAGTWATFKQGLRDEPQSWGFGFWGLAVDHFGDVFSLWLVKLAVNAVTALLWLAILILGVQAAMSGALAAASPLFVAGSFALGLTCFALGGLLIRLVFLVAGAPLILDNVDVGEALLRAAIFSLEHLLSLYRLFLVGLAVVLIPLGVYLAAALFNNITLIAPELAPLTALFRLGAEVLLWTSITLLTVWVYGAVFAFYFHGDQRWPMEGFESQETEDPDPDDLSDFSSIDEMLPEEAPHRSRLSDLLEATDGGDDRLSEDTGSGEITPEDESQEPPQDPPENN